MVPRIIARVLETAGDTPDNIIKLSMWVVDRAMRPTVLMRRQAQLSTRPCGAHHIGGMNEDPDTPTAAVSAASGGAAAGPFPTGDNPVPPRRDSEGPGDQPAGGTANQAAAEEDVVDLPGKVTALGFEIAKSIRYHAKRCAFFEALNHFTRGVAAIFAAAAIVSIVGKNGLLSAVANTLVAVTLSGDLVLDYSRHAQVHDDLRREFAELLAEMEEHPATIDEDYRRFSAQRLRIQVREPPTIEVLNVVCANEELEGRGYDYRYRVAPLQFALRNFFSWNAREFPKVQAPTAKR